jgi:hypothetical protein
MMAVDSAFGTWPNGPRPTINDFVEKLKALPSDLAESDVLRPKLRLYADNVISVYFTPFPSVNRTGRVFLVGLTPGRHQHWLATATAASALRAGNSPRAAAIKAGSVGSSMGWGWPRHSGWRRLLNCGPHMSTCEQRHRPYRMPSSSPPPVGTTRGMCRRSNAIPY